MAEKLDPIERYERLLNRRLIRLADEVGPIGRDCMKKFGIPTVTKLFKDHFTQCVKDMKNEVARLEKEERIKNRLKAQHRKYHWLWRHAHEITREELNVHARDLASAIYDLPVVVTGFVSEALLDQGGEKCPEHFHPRQWAGHVLLEYIYFNQGIELDILRKFADVFRQVHYTTSEENNRLRPHQLVGTYTTWEKSYEDAGIKLVHKKDNGPIHSIEEFWSPVAV